MHNQDHTVTMPTQREWELQLRRSFEQKLAREEGELDFVKEITHAAFLQFLEQGLPTHKHEEWKYVNLSRLLHQPCLAAMLTAEGQLEGTIGAEFDLREELATCQLSQLKKTQLTDPNSPLWGDGFEHICLHNGRITQKPSQAGSESVYVASVAEAIAGDSQHSGVISEHFAQVQQDPNAYALLNTSFCRSEDVLYIYVPPGVSVSETYNLWLLSALADTHKLYNPRVLLVLGESSSLKLNLWNLANQASVYSGRGHYVLNNAVVEIVQASNSHLELCSIGDSHSQNCQLLNLNIQQDAHAQCQIHHFDMGGGLRKNNFQVELSAPGASCSLYGLFEGRGEQASHQQIKIKHLASETHSQQLFKAVLQDQSAGEFTGAVQVVPEAQRIEAEQLSRTLLLSPQTKIHNRPQLDVAADDVKCSHGASISRLEPEQLFYFASRGLSMQQAEQMLIHSFRAELIEKVSQEFLRSLLIS